jgi:hypothetical protein
VVLAAVVLSRREIAGLPTGGGARFSDERPDEQVEVRGAEGDERRHPDVEGLNVDHDPADRGASPAGRAARRLARRIQEPVELLAVQLRPPELVQAQCLDLAVQALEVPVLRDEVQRG